MKTPQIILFIRGVTMNSRQDKTHPLFYWFRLVLLAMTLCACSYKPSVEYSMTPAVPTDNGTSVTHRPTVVILPLADYSQGQTLDAATRRQAKIMACLSRDLYRIGLVSAIQDDVNRYLLDSNIIHKVRQTPKPLVAYFQASQWGELTNSVVDEINTSVFTSPPQEELDDTGLKPGVIRSIAFLFGADYLLRGRIIEYEVRKGFSMNPLRRGVLPFFFDSASSVIFGVAKSDTYDMLQDTAIGGTMGGLLGSDANTPFNAPQKTTKIVGSSPRFAHEVTKESGGYDNYATYNSLVWGAVGAGVAALAKKGGDVPEAVVQLQMALQEPSGRVEWTNTAEVRVSLGSAFSDSRKRILLDKALSEACNMLVSDLGRAVFGIRQVAGQNHSSPEGS